MRIIKKLLAWSLLLVGSSVIARPPAHQNHNIPSGNPTTTQVGYRAGCDQATQQTDMAINNVRARLLNGGDLWWDLKNGKYIVPKVDPKSGQPEVSSLFAGAVWLGGIDPGKNLKVACQQYRSSSANDFWPGPLNPTDGTVDVGTCKQWDKFFRVTGEDIRKHIKNYNFHKLRGEDYPVEEIPKAIKSWPSRGNKFFQEFNGFDLPNTNQGLALFFDTGNDGDYNPEEGDYPVIDIRGCPNTIFPDEMVFWIYNDAGNIHTQTNATAIQMEVQVQSFAFTTQDELNDMTFYRFKLINRAIDRIDSCFFAMWIDPDLGCSEDDYIGCDTIYVKTDTCELPDGSFKYNPRRRDLMYVYNADAVDGVTGCSCPVNGSNTNTYCNNVPILGCDYFRGPLDEDGCELGMSSFMYFTRNGTIQATTDPSGKAEFYNILNGRWKDGTPLTVGGSGYNLGSTNVTKFAFSSPPNDPNGWNMCSAALPKLDQRTIQASGPLKLLPGAVNELIIGVPWVPNIQYPCPDLEPLLYADRLAQGLFDNCFKILDGPTAPDLDWIEQNRELVCILSNDEGSNNFKENYKETDFLAPTNIPTADKQYVFEGYKVYQLISPDVARSELDDRDKARLVLDCDLKNGVKKVYNWTGIKNPNPLVNEPYYVPTLKQESPDEGVVHSFSITDDQFGSGSSRGLINHKKYYFLSVAYAHNNFKEFDAADPRAGQRTPYIEGRLNVKTYTVIPRPIVDVAVQAKYGDGPQITRLEGVGAGHIALDLQPGEHERILDPSFNGELTYQQGKGPLNIKIYDPLHVKNGEFELFIYDNTPNDEVVDKDALWRIKDVATGKIIESERTIERLNEQLISDYGFSVNIAQSPEVGDLTQKSNGAIAQTIEYKNNGTPWLLGLPDDASPVNGTPFTPFNYIPTDNLEKYNSKDPDQSLTKIGNGYFVPYALCDAATPATPQEFKMSPRWWPPNGSFSNAAQPVIANLNNVDIVFTSDKSKWSRCIIVETANNLYTDNSANTLDLNTESAPGTGAWRRRSMDTRYGLSVSKDDNDGDGKPDPDGSIEPATDPTTNAANPDAGKQMRGMGWFPGYAVDVETGERLNIFFGENSIYDGIYDFDPLNTIIKEPTTGRDMMFNPTNQGGVTNYQQFTPYAFCLGGQHFIYVTKQKYDGCDDLRWRLDPDKVANTNKKYSNKIPKIKDNITWCGMFMTQQGQQMKSYKDGLIPVDCTVKLRVDNPYQFKAATAGGAGYPHYRFKIEGKAAVALDAVSIGNSLDSIKMVPNPYYGYSDYESSQFTNIVKISNLPAKCVVTIYSLDGKFIRQYDRNELPTADPDRANPPVPNRQYLPDVEWDMKNSKGIPVASGVYLVHISAPGYGERTLKWFGIGREFDPSGL